MVKLIDLTGLRFGRWTVLGYDLSRPVKRYQHKWLCACDCGARKSVNGQNLRVGLTKSCGCLNREVAVKFNTAHGECRTVEYQTLTKMIQRCENPRDKSYPRYGGRGIKVCARWKTVTNFVSDMGRRPSAKHSIDRIDPNGDYEPGNCRWATRSTQSLNRRSFGKYGRGIAKEPWGYRVRFTFNGQYVSFGSFKTLREARAASAKGLRELLARSHQLPSPSSSISP